MINHKIRQKPTSDTDYVAFLSKHGVKPLDKYEKNGTTYYVFDYQDTKLLKIAYKALN